MYNVPSLTFTQLTLVVMRQRKCLATFLWTGNYGGDGGNGA